MPNYNQRINNTFIKGLITEAGEMTFPENASIDELNCALSRDGTRSRRRAVVFETNNVLSTFNVTPSSLISFGEWVNVGGDASKSYVVIQVGNRLYFYDKAVYPFSSGQKTNFVDLSAYEVGSTGGASTAKCSFATILGRLVVVSENTEPVYIEELSNGSFSATQIDCKVRDFKWLGNKATYTEEVSSATVSDERKYDTKNAGWVAPKGSNALTSYISANSAYPPLTHPWHSGKDSNNNFSVSEWEKIFTGTSLIGNGHYILDLFNKDRATASGIAGLALETEDKRFKTVASFSGRVFFAGLDSADSSGKVYFSQLLEDMSAIGSFYQTNDPTSEEFSDILDTDGGVIVIPDATDIKKVYAFRSSVFVFADNGVWQITGVDNVFSPSAYSVARVSEIGIVSESSFTAAEGVPFWWSRSGIHTLSFNEFGSASEENLSINTIQTFWDNISPQAKLDVQAEYDKVNKKIYWLYKNSGELLTNKYNNILILDISLQAFYPWKISDMTASTDYVIGMQFYRGFSATEETLDVVIGANDVVIAPDDVVATGSVSRDDNDVALAFFALDRSTDKITVATFSGTSFLDWGLANYSSYAEVGYDFLGDAVLKKTAPYVVFYLRETEVSWVETAEGGYLPVTDSSLLVSAFWDFKKGSSSTPQQAYRRKLAPVVDETDLSSYNSNETVVETRLKLRGRGRSLKIRIESETGKDFIYIGHGLVSDTASRF